MAESGLNVKAGSFVLFRRHIYIILKAKASRQERERIYWEVEKRKQINKQTIRRGEKEDEEKAKEKKGYRSPFRGENRELTRGKMQTAHRRIAGSRGSFFRSLFMVH